MRVRLRVRLRVRVRVRARVRVRVSALRRRRGARATRHVSIARESGEQRTCQDREVARW